MVRRKLNVKLLARARSECSVSKQWMQRGFQARDAAFFELCPDAAAASSPVTR